MAQWCAHTVRSVIRWPCELTARGGSPGCRCVRTFRRVVAFCVCRYWVVTRLVTRRVRAHSCVRETCVRRLRAAWGVTVYGIVLPFARGWCCFLRVTHHDINKKNRPDIPPDPGVRRPQRPYAQGGACAKQDQVQASAPGLKQNRAAGGGTTNGRRTRQTGETLEQRSQHRNACPAPVR